MQKYIECVECGFVLYAMTFETADPKHWDAYPDCEGTEFEFVGD